MSNQEQKKAFFERVDSLSAGDRAALKRSAGVMLSDADGKAIAAFYRCVPGTLQLWEEDRWFAVACLKCLWDAAPEGGTGLEEAVADLIRQKALSESITHRIESLMDTPWDSDGYMLTTRDRFVKLLRQKNDEAHLDFGSLLSDLLNWNRDDQRVQRKWARTIFADETD